MFPKNQESGMVGSCIWRAEVRLFRIVLSASEDDLGNDGGKLNADIKVVDEAASFETTIYRDR